MDLRDLRHFTVVGAVIDVFREVRASLPRQQHARGTRRKYK